MYDTYEEGMGWEGKTEHLSALWHSLQVWGIPPGRSQRWYCSGFPNIFNQKAFLLSFSFLISLPLAICDVALTDKVQIAPKYPEIRDEAKDDDMNKPTTKKKSPAARLAILKPMISPSL